MKNTIALTILELELVALLRARVTDRTIRAMMGLEQAELLRLTHSVRAKLGVGPTELIRDVAARVDLVVA